MCVGHSSEDEQRKVNKGLRVWGRARDVGLGIFRVTMKLGEWLRY